MELVHLMNPKIQDFFPTASFMNLCRYEKSYGYQPVVMLGGLNKQVGKEVSKDRSGGIILLDNSPERVEGEN